MLLSYHYKLFLKNKMNPTPKPLRNLFFCATLFLIAISLALPASAEVGIDRISVSANPSEIKPGESFTVNITFKDADDSDNVNVRIIIEVDGTVVHNKTHDIDLRNGNDTSFSIASGDFRSRGDNIYNENLMNYECGEHDVKVKVSGDVNDKEDSDTLTITPDPDNDEHILNIEVDPSNPVLDEDLTITVKDDNGDPVKSIKVKFTWVDDNKKDVWEVDDPSEEAGATDNDGETTFNIVDDLKEEYGKYQVDAYKTNYCKDTTTISFSEGELTIGNPDPANPVVGQQFRILVTDGTNPLSGVRASINELGVRLSSTSGSDGYLKFTINQEGTFTIFINASGYDETQKAVTVSALSGLIISITPTPAEVSSAVTITVFSNGQPVQGASLTITKPGGGKSVITTDSGGAASYLPEQSGQYSVSASKQGYQNDSEPFTVNSAFTVQLPDASSIVYGSDLTITVLDSSTNVPVANALISGTGVAYGSRTNSMGQFTFKLGASGQYSFVVSKEGFNDKGVSVIALCRLQLKLNATSTELGKPISVRVLDKEKNDYVSGNIAVTMPDGSSETKVESEIAVTPNAAGTYAIAVSKANCVGDQASIEAKERQVRFEGELKDGKIVIQALSGGRPVSGVEVRVTSPSGNSATAVSDENGLITINAAEVGEYTITPLDGGYTGSPISIAREQSFLSKYWFIILVGFISLLILILLVMIVVLFLRSRRKPDTSFGKGKGSSLGG